MKLEFFTFVKYCLIGFSGFIIDMMLYYFFVSHVHLPYLFANVISIMVGISNNFILNACYNFRITDKLLFRMISFWLVGGIGLSISSGMLFMLVRSWHMHPMMAKACTLAVVPIIQFTLNRFVTFRASGASMQPASE